MPEHKDDDEFIPLSQTKNYNLWIGVLFLLLGLFTLFFVEKPFNTFGALLGCFGSIRLFMALRKPKDE
jgi:hypothetical protein